MTLEDIIEAAINTLGLTESVRRLSDTEADSAIHAVSGEFIKDASSLWWWESIRPDRESVAYQSGGNGYQLIAQVCPDEPCWFVATDDRADGWSVYEARPSQVVSVLGECHAFEYFLASPELRWVVFENHHDVLVGVGAEVTEAISLLSR